MKRDSRNGHIQIFLGFLAYISWTFADCIENCCKMFFFVAGNALCWKHTGWYWFLVITEMWSWEIAGNCIVFCSLKLTDLLLLYAPNSNTKSRIEFYIYLTLWKNAYLSAFIYQINFKVNKSEKHRKTTASFSTVCFGWKILWCIFFVVLCFPPIAHRSNFLNQRTRKLECKRNCDINKVFQF